MLSPGCAEAQCNCVGESREGMCDIWRVGRTFTRQQRETGQNGQQRRHWPSHACSLAGVLLHLFFYSLGLLGELEIFSSLSVWVQGMYNH